MIFLTGRALMINKKIQKTLKLLESISSKVNNPSLTELPLTIDTLNKTLIEIDNDLFKKLKKLEKVNSTSSKLELHSEKLKTLETEALKYLNPEAIGILLHFDFEKYYKLVDINLCTWWTKIVLIKQRPDLLNTIKFDLSFDFLDIIYSNYVTSDDTVLYKKLITSINASIRHNKKSNFMVNKLKKLLREIEGKKEA